MQLVSWATLLTLLVPDLVEMRSPDAAAAVRKDRLHPRQGNVALDPQGPPPPPLHHHHRRRRHPAPGVKKATKVTSSGGGCRGGRGAHTHPAACAPATARRGRLGPLPSARPPTPFPVCAQKQGKKKKIQVSPPPIFSFLFSLSFVPLSHSHSLLRSEMPTDSPASRFRVTCPLFFPRD